MRMKGSKTKSTISAWKLDNERISSTMKRRRNCGKFSNLILIYWPLYFFGEFCALPVGVAVPDPGDLFLFKFFFEELRFLNRSLLRSGFSNFNLICVRMPTSSSSTLWLIPTDVSMYLQSYDVAIDLPSATINYESLLSAGTTFTR